MRRRGSLHSRGAIAFATPISFSDSASSWLQLSRFKCFCCGFLTASSSDTTHKAILHNLVSHQRNLQRQVTDIQRELRFLKQQLSGIAEQLHQLLGSHAPITPQHAEADRGQGHEPYDVE